MPKHTKGFTLIELLVVISIIAFLTLAGIFTFNIIRMEARDATRVADASTISRSLAMYLNDSATGYPISNGECLSPTSGVGQTLINTKSLAKAPSDPLWPSAAPAALDPLGYAVLPSEKFCYWYRGLPGNYYLSYYLESNSKSGRAGIHVISPAGNVTTP